MLKMEMKNPILVKSLRGKIKATRMCPNVSLDIKDANFEVNLVVLESMEIDDVLVRGWLIVVMESLTGPNTQYP